MFVRARRGELVGGGRSINIWNINVCFHFLPVYIWTNTISWYDKQDEENEVTRKRRKKGQNPHYIMHNSTTFNGEKSH